MIAPDLIGHGDSATPRGDYSLGAHAASIRDLLTDDRGRAGDDRRPLARRRRRDAVLLPIPPAHRAPGADLQRRPRPRGQPAAARRRAARLGRAAAARDAAAAGRRARRRRRAAARPAATPPASTCRRSRGRCGPLQEPGSRRAFLQTLRSVIDVHGQKVSARDRLYLLERHADPDRLGRARPHDPDRARPRGRSGRSPTAASRPCRGPPTSPTSKTPRASPPSSATSSPPPPPAGSTTPSGETCWPAGAGPRMPPASPERGYSTSAIARFDFGPGSGPPAGSGSRSGR